MFGLVNGSQDHELSKKHGLYFNIGHSKRDNEMKHILPILTLTTLAGAAFADAGAAAPVAPAASDLSYNNISVIYNQLSVSGVSGHVNSWTLSATAMIGNSNFTVQGQTIVGGDYGNGYDTATLGYVFKNSAADVIVVVGSNEFYGVRIRKNLGSNFEGTASYARQADHNEYGLSVGYNFTKQVSFDLSYTKVDIAASITHWTAGLRYNF